MKGQADGEAHLLPLAGGHHLRRVEAGVGPQGEFARVPRPAHPGYRLGDEAGDSLGSVGRSTPQAGVQDLAGCGQDRE